MIALVGFLRYQHHQSLAEIRQSLHTRGLAIGERAVLNLLARYKALVTLYMTNQERLQPLVQKQGSLILAVDGKLPREGRSGFIGQAVRRGEPFPSRTLEQAQPCSALV